MGSGAPACIWLALQGRSSRPGLNEDGSNTMSGGHWKDTFHAACDGDLALLEHHVRAGVDVNFAHPEFLATPLVASIFAKQETAALYRLAHGACPHLLSEFDGLTLVEAAHRVGLHAATRRLRELGAAAAGRTRLGACRHGCRGWGRGCCAGIWRAHCTAFSGPRSAALLRRARVCCERAVAT